jgi:L-ribulose-5-phosphate 3-epimerase UlaE
MSTSTTPNYIVEFTKIQNLIAEQLTLATANNNTVLISILRNLATADTELQVAFTNIYQDDSTLQTEINELVKELVLFQTKIILHKCSTALSTSAKSPGVKELVSGLTKKIKAMNELIDLKK